ncbi:MAG: alpha-glucosidase [Clostridia bacterium]|nr:alpha-glucosidase [Clostridia bacterium]
MISKIIFGKPFETNAAVLDVPAAEDIPDYISVDSDNISIKYTLGASDKVYGLGESVRGINKRGWIYETYCSDDPLHTETKRSLYGAHPFVIIDGIRVFGLFVDYPDRVVFDIGYTSTNEMTIRIGAPDYTLYVIEGNTPNDVAISFRKLIGRSYVAPFWAFGFQQSRWSYYTRYDVENVIRNYRDNGFPLDAVYLDIDYMENFKDFTVSDERFPDFENFVSKAAKENIHLVPIIDAGVKIEDGYDVYEEGKKGNYFVKDSEGKNFTAAVWPGKVCFPDFLNSAAAEWFGMKYKTLIDKGIDGFWNDMNEPAIFYSESRLEKALDKIADYRGKNIGIYDFFGLKDTVLGLSNNGDDYSAMYHNLDGNIICHNKVHNLYGTSMTKAAADAFAKIAPDKNILIFSRASYIGMHRYSGIWMGDNQSWWSHIKLNLQMLPSLNMCGFLYTGADLVGFGDNCTEELALRWLALGIFTPLMRNHSALGTREQEFYRFENRDVFRNLLNLRYALIPYIYSEYIRAVNNFDLMFKPLAFVYHGDKYAEAVEDQLMVGENIMIAPVYEPNAIGRSVYIPEDMLAVFFRSADDYDLCNYNKGHHFIEIPSSEVVVFIRKNKTLPLISPAQSTAELDFDTVQFIKGSDNAESYTIYTENNTANLK